MTIVQWVAAIRVGWRRAMKLASAQLRPARSAEFNHPRMQGMFPGKSIDQFTEHIHAKDKRGENPQTLPQEFEGWVKQN